MKPRFLVIGSNSFSGAHFIGYLLDLGHYVLGVSRSDEPHTVFLPYRWLEGNQQERFQFQRIDLNHDLDRLMDLIQEHRPEYIVNFAAQSMYGGGKLADSGALVPDERGRSGQVA